MWTSLFVIALARAEVSELRVEKTVIERETPRPKPWALDAVLELRSSLDQRPRPTNRSRQAVHEFSVGARYDFGEGVKARLELSLEQINQQSTFFAKQAFVSYQPTEFAAAHAGQQFLPVGLIAPRDNWFSSNPPYYQKLFRGAKPVDLGVTLQAFPLARARRELRQLAWLEAAAFSGHLVREQDQRVAAPERAPRVLSVKSASEFHDAFVTYFDHDLAFVDPIRAAGVGFEVRGPARWRVRPSLLAETWGIRQSQRQGPDEVTRAYTLYGEIDWWRLKLGYRFGQADARVPGPLGSDVLPRERSHLAVLEARVARVLSLRVERVFARQDAVLSDDWVYRALLNVTEL